MVYTSRIKTPKVRHLTLLLFGLEDRQKNSVIQNKTAVTVIVRPQSYGHNLPYSYILQSTLKALLLSLFCLIFSSPLLSTNSTLKRIKATVRSSCLSSEPQGRGVTTRRFLKHFSPDSAPGAGWTSYSDEPRFWPPEEQGRREDTNKLLENWCRRFWCQTWGIVWILIEELHLNQSVEI